MGRISIIIDGLFNMDRFFVEWMMLFIKFKFKIIYFTNSDYESECLDSSLVGRYPRTLECSNKA